jgi:hypothetical protein
VQLSHNASWKGTGSIYGIIYGLDKHILDCI